MLKRLLENGGFFNLEGEHYYFVTEFDRIDKLEEATWEYDGKEYNAKIEIEVEEINEKEVQITINQINNKSSAICLCLFSEEYNLDETEQFLLDLEAQELEFIIDKLEEIL